MITNEATYFLKSAINKEDEREIDKGDYDKVMARYRKRRRKLAIGEKLSVYRDGVLLRQCSSGSSYGDLKAQLLAA